MMIKVIYLATLLAFATNQVSAQLLVDRQLEVAKTYISFIQNGQQEESWQLLDRAKLPNVTKEQFGNAFVQIKNTLASYDSFPLFTAIVLTKENKTFHRYRFKVLATKKNIISDAFIDLFFADTSAFVAGMQLSKTPKDSNSITSNNKETPLEKKFAAVINGTTYNIRGIHIVHFTNNTGFLVIQVERRITEQEFKNDSWTKPEAKVFAKYLVENHYLERATLKARELNLNIASGLGVSFVDPGTEEGINVQVDLADIK